MQNQHNYSVDDIKVMEGLEAVRVRPGMYIGSTGSRGLHHMLWEIVDNAVDEAANGFATTVSVTINRDNSVVVESCMCPALKLFILNSMRAENSTTIHTGSRADCTVSVHRLLTRFPNTLRLRLQRAESCIQ